MFQVWSIRCSIFFCRVPVDKNNFTLKKVLTNTKPPSNIPHKPRQFPFHRRIAPPIAPLSNTWPMECFCGASCENTWRVRFCFFSCWGCLRTRWHEAKKTRTNSFCQVCLPWGIVIPSVQAYFWTTCTYWTYWSLGLKGLVGWSQKDPKKIQAMKVDLKSGKGFGYGWFSYP